MQRRQLEGFDEYFIADDGSIYHNRGMTYTETELCND